RGRAVRAGRGVAHRAGTPQRAPLRAARAAQPGDRRDGASHGTRAPSAAVLPATPARRVRGARGCLGGGAAAARQLRGARPVGRRRAGGHPGRSQGAVKAAAARAAELRRLIDGAAVSLTYQDGMFVTGATRGNGVEGEDVTANLRTVLDVPLRLHGKGWPKLMEVRGEVYLSKSRFVELNKERERAGEPTFANPRNAAAGALRQLDPKVTRSRGLRIFCFHVEAPGQKLPVTTQHDLLKQLAAWGYPVELLQQ